MDEFLVEIAEILEEDTVKPTDLMDSFSSWDSLAVLSVIAMAGANFGNTLSSREVSGAATVQDLYDLIITKKTVV